MTMRRTRRTPLELLWARQVGNALILMFSGWVVTHIHIDGTFRRVGGIETSVLQLTHPRRKIREVR